MVNHRHPSKAIVMEGRFYRISEFSPFRDRVSLTLSHLSESALSRDCVRFVSTETESDQSLPRANRHSTLGVFYINSDHEIDKTFHRLRKVGNTIIVDSSSSGSILNSKNSNFATDESHFSKYPKIGSMENNDRTPKELATPDVLEPAQSYELKPGLIHLLPKFHGFVREDPHKHLKEFHVVCSTMRPQGILEDYIKVKAFPVSLDGAAKD
ncbi:hypothetical protein CR513_36589, partial [Mucuna pruriens]